MDEDEPVAEGGAKPSNPDDLSAYKLDEYDDDEKSGYVAKRSRGCCLLKSKELLGHLRTLVD